jgi:hypothetical protein
MPRKRLSTRWIDAARELGYEDPCSVLKILYVDNKYATYESVAECLRQLTGAQFTRGSVRYQIHKCPRITPKSKNHPNCRTKHAPRLPMGPKAPERKPTPTVKRPAPPIENPCPTCGKELARGIHNYFCWSVGCYYEKPLPPEPPLKYKPLLIIHDCRRGSGSYTGGATEYVAE